MRPSINWNAPDLFEKFKSDDKKKEHARKKKLTRTGWITARYAEARLRGVGTRFARQLFSELQERSRRIALIRKLATRNSWSRQLAAGLALRLKPKEVPERRLLEALRWLAMDPLVEVWGPAAAAWGRACSISAQRIGDLKVGREQGHEPWHWYVEASKLEEAPRNVGTTVAVRSPFEFHFAASALEPDDERDGPISWRAHTAWGAALLCSPERFSQKERTTFGEWMAPKADPYRAATTMLSLLAIMDDETSVAEQLPSVLEQVGRGTAEILQSSCILLAQREVPTELEDAIRTSLARPMAGTLRLWDAHLWFSMARPSTTPHSGLADAVRIARRNSEDREAPRDGDVTGWLPMAEAWRIEKERPKTRRSPTISIVEALLDDLAVAVHAGNKFESKRAVEILAVLRATMAASSRYDDGIHEDDVYVVRRLMTLTLESLAGRDPQLMSRLFRATLYIVADQPGLAKVLPEWLPRLLPADHTLTAKDLRPIRRDFAMFLGMAGDACKLGQKGLLSDVCSKDAPASFPDDLDGCIDAVRRHDFWHPDGLHRMSALIRTSGGRHLVAELLRSDAPEAQPVIIGDRGHVFYVKERIGHGRTATVYRCSKQNDASGKDYAVKILKNDKDPDERFRRELLVLHTLRRVPGVPQHQPYDGTSEGSRYLVMDYVRGDTLKHWLGSHSRLSLTGSIGYLAQLGRTLETIHERGVVHRDLSHNNVMVAYDDRIFVIDWGYAYIPGQEVRGLENVRTVKFHAPEWSEPTRNQAPALDWYSFGVIAALLLVGDAGFTNNRLDAVRLSHEQVPAQVIDALLDLTSPDPEQRPSTATPLLDALRA